MNSAVKMVLVSLDEGDFQPLGLASPAAHIRQAGHAVDVVDRFQDMPLNWEGADAVAFSVPIFAAIQPTIREALTIRKKGFRGPIIFYNQYATVQPETFILDEDCRVVLGEYEPVLCDIAQRLAEDDGLDEVAHLWDGRSPKPAKCLKRVSDLPPDRSGLPALDLYARKNGLVVGNIETMRGCAHPCSYCSVYAAYERRVVKHEPVAIDMDIDRVVALGAEHITFVDADFFSTGQRGLQIVRAMASRHPGMPFDVTVRLDDVIRYEAAVHELREPGCVEFTTACEFPDDAVLEAVNKGMSVADMQQGLAILKGTGARVRPTFITFNPWTTKDDFGRLDRFLADAGMTDMFDEMQRTTRLLLYKGSPLLALTEVQKLSKIDMGSYYEWQHADPQTDAIYLSIDKSDASVSRKRCCIKG